MNGWNEGMRFWKKTTQLIFLTRTLALKPLSRSSALSSFATFYFYLFAPETSRIFFQFSQSSILTDDSAISHPPIDIRTYYMYISIIRDLYGMQRNATECNGIQRNRTEYNERIKYILNGSPGSLSLTGSFSSRLVAAGSTGTIGRLTVARTRSYQRQIQRIRGNVYVWLSFPAFVLFSYHAVPSTLSIHIFAGSTND